MTRADIAAGVLLATGFGAALWEATTFQYGTEFAPGPGFAPIWLSVLGIALALLLIGNGLRARTARARDDGDKSEQVSGLRRVVATVTGLVVMLASVTWLGFVTSMLFFLLYLTLVVQRLSVVTAIATSLATIVFIYIVFVRLLGVPIPSGPLGF